MIAIVIQNELDARKACSLKCLAKQLVLLHVRAKVSRVVGLIKILCKKQRHINCRNCSFFDFLFDSCNSTFLHHKQPDDRFVVVACDDSKHLQFWQIV